VRACSKRFSFSQSWTNFSFRRRAGKVCPCFRYLSPRSVSQRERERERDRETERQRERQRDRQTDREKERERRRERERVRKREREM
jgi:hypothetical protein